MACTNSAAAPSVTYPQASAMVPGLGLDPQLVLELGRDLLLLLGLQLPLLLPLQFSKAASFDP